MDAGSEGVKGRSQMPRPSLLQGVSIDRVMSLRGLGGAVLRIVFSETSLTQSWQEQTPPSTCQSKKWAGQTALAVHWTTPTSPQLPQTSSFSLDQDKPGRKGRDFNQREVRSTVKHGGGGIMLWDCSAFQTRMFWVES